MNHLCHRFNLIAIKSHAKQVKLFNPQSCYFSSKSNGNDLKPVIPSSDASLERKRTESGVKLNRPSGELEPRDNRIKVKRPFLHVDKFLPTTWVQWARTKKENYFFPPVTVIFKKDGVSRARYTVCYRAEYSRLYVGWGASMTPFIILGCIGFGIYGLLGDRSDDPDYDPYDFNQSAATSIGAILMGLYFLAAWQYIARMKLIRMYYSKDKKEFILVWFNPWCPFWIRKMSCKAGEAKLLKGVSGALFHNTEINGKKFLIAPENFAFSAYFNVLYGYSDPKDIEKILHGNETADQHFRNKKAWDKSNIYNVYK